MTEIPQITYHKADREFATEIQDWGLGLYAVSILTAKNGSTLFEGILNISQNPHDEMLMSGILTEARSQLKVAVAKLRKMGYTHRRHAILSKGDTLVESYQGRGINTVIRSIMMKMYQAQKHSSTVETYTELSNFASIKASWMAVDPVSNAPFATQRTILPSDEASVADQILITTQLDTQSTISAQLATFLKIQELQAKTSVK